MPWGQGGAWQNCERIRKSQMTSRHVSRRQQTGERLGGSGGLDEGDASCPRVEGAALGDLVTHWAAGSEGRVWEN